MARERDKHNTTWGSRLDTTLVVGGGEKEKEASTQLQGGEQTGHYPCS